MVILRQERIFTYAGKGKFNDCWLVILFENGGPALMLYKDSQNKKEILERIDLKEKAVTFRFGTTCVPYGNAPVAKKDKRIDVACYMTFQVERLVRKIRTPRLVWLCAESAKQMIGILKIFAHCLTFLDIPAPPPNGIPDDPYSLAHYKPRLLKPANQWESFWENPPAARLLSPLEMAKNLTRSPRTTDIEQVEEHQRPGSVSTTQERVPGVLIKQVSWSSVDEVFSRSSDNGPIHELRKLADVPKRPISQAPKQRKYDRVEPSNSSPSILRHQKKNSEALEGEVLAVESHPLKMRAAPPPPEEGQPLLYQESADDELEKYVYYMPKHCSCCTHNHQPEVARHRPTSGVSSAYGSAPTTPTHLQREFGRIGDEILRRGSELTLRPVVVRPEMPEMNDGKKERASQEVHYELQSETDEEVSRPVEAFEVQPTVENGISAISRTETRHVTFVSRGIQTDHELPDPPIALIDDYGFAQVAKFHPEDYNLAQAPYRRLSGASLRSIYLRHLEEGEWEDTLGGSTPYRDPLIKQENDDSEYRSYTVEITQHTQF